MRDDRAFQIGRPRCASQEVRFAIAVSLAIAGLRSSNGGKGLGIAGIKTWAAHPRIWGHASAARLGRALLTARSPAWSTVATRLAEREILRPARLAPYRRAAYRVIPRPIRTEAIRAVVPADRRPPRAPCGTGMCRTSKLRSSMVTAWSSEHLYRRTQASVRPRNYPNIALSESGDHRSQHPPRPFTPSNQILRRPVPASRRCGNTVTTMVRGSRT